MLKTMLGLVAIGGLTACDALPTSKPVLCDALAMPVAELRAGLLANPDTADAVGEPATDVVIIAEAGCAL